MAIKVKVANSYHNVIMNNKATADQLIGKKTTNFGYSNALSSDSADCSTDNSCNYSCTGNLYSKCDSCTSYCHAGCGDTCKKECSGSCHTVGTAG